MRPHDPTIRPPPLSLAAIYPRVLESRHSILIAVFCSRPDNHKPTLSSDASPASARLKPSSSSTASSTDYDLSFTDDGGKYAYNGSRSTKANQYALIFDPERKAFVLHRVDSTFNMNLTRTPSNADADALKEEHPHLDSGSIRVSMDGNASKKGPGGAKGTGTKKGGRGNAAKNAGMVESKRSAPSSNPAAKTKAAAAAAESAKEDKNKATSTAPATKEADKPKRAPRSPLGSEDEDDSDDDGLLVEYPDPQPAATGSYGRAPAHQTSSAPQPTQIRRFSEFMANRDGDDESDEDADAEYDEDDLLVEDEAGDSSAGDGFKLPSPVGRSVGQGQGQGGEGAGGDAPGEDDDTPADDELMAMLEEEMGEGGMDVDSESSVSEED